MWGVRPLARFRLRESDRQRLEPLLARGWSLPAEEHPLGRLQDRSLGGCRLLGLLGPKNSVGARYFQLFLTDDRGRLSDDFVALGLHNAGPYPGYNWIDLIRYQGAPAFEGDVIELADKGRARRLFRSLSELVPPGGHLMVEYESPGQRESVRLLALGYPPATTPLGRLLFQAGCRSFRDWYISEGGREGPRKLQGFKPLNQTNAEERTAALRREVEERLAGPESPRHGEWGRTARRLAKAVLEELAKEQGTGNREQGPATPRVP